jgi:hypothetical protein
MRIPLPGRRFVDMSVGKIPQVATSGVVNRTADCLYVPFFEYDKVDKTVPLEDAIFFQRNFNIGTLLFLTSSKEYDKENVEVGNYHMVGFTKWTFPEVKELIELSRSDFPYKRGWDRPARCWVLRVSEKLDLKGNVVKAKPYKPVVLRAPSTRAASYGTIKFFEKCYGVSILDLFDVRDNEKMWPQVVEYPTR